MVQAPSTMKRREFLKLVVFGGAGAALKLLAPDVFAQTSGITAEKARALLSEKVNYTSAPFGNTSISIKTGTASISVGSQTVDISNGLKGIGISLLSAEAKIIYGGKEEDKYQIYFITDAKANGVLKLYLKSDGELLISEPMATTSVNIATGFSFAAASNNVVATLCGTKITVFDFGQRRMRPIELSRVIAEKDPKNPKLVAKTEGGSVYFLMSADNFNTIYVYDHTKGVIQAFPKK
ncbi:MAG: hypothetical protein AB1468_06810 [Candidatus Micrarchaeota archaeon]